MNPFGGAVNYFEKFIIDSGALKTRVLVEIIPLKTPNKASSNLNQLIT
jgi:hypothetical protein